MKKSLATITLIIAVKISALAQFIINDVAVGDPNVSYASIEFTSQWEYMVWDEMAGNGTDTTVTWHCGIDSMTGNLIPPDGKGFRAIESTIWGRATPGRDSQGVFYVGMNRSGQLVLVRPTNATTGTVTILPTPVDVTRRAIYATDLPQQPSSVGYVFWIKNSNVPGGPGNTQNTWVELRYISLSNPSVEVVLQHQNRPPAPSTGWAPLDAVFPRCMRGSAKVTSGIRDTNGYLQVVEFDLSQATPTALLVTAATDTVSKTDAFPWTFGNQDILMSGIAGGTGATNIYTRPVNTQFFTPVEVITPMVATLTPPVFSQSNERIPFCGMPYTCFQVNGSDTGFFQTIFGPGEIWLSTILQSPQQQWRLSEDSLTGKNDNEPYVGHSKVWVFYLSTPRDSALLTTVAHLHRCETPLSCLTGVAEQSNSNSTVVYPNPASTEIKINLPSNNNFEIEIFNTLGETVLKTKNKSTIDISQLSTGIYFLKINQANQFYSAKFVRQ